ncbi:hypothetical protein BB560_004393 [Smittium megazygosporum]|uniref:TATA-binding protein interacting (TIP20) domain-containing protein n=1 Tax=Smittium megazygosporum TaxID=133381 RepID=A0A2T9Z9F0_9FUNG|nr:hypothetical protein BB560_004393 [Smittium megazygosporum]
MSSISIELEKLYVLMADPDRDFRYMALLDLTKIIETCTDYDNFLFHEKKIFSNLTKALNESIAEVLNLVINCLGTLASKASPRFVLTMLSSLLDPIYNNLSQNGVTTHSAAIRKMILNGSKDPKTQSEIEKKFLPELILKLQLFSNDYTVFETLSMINTALESTSSSFLLEPNYITVLQKSLMEILESSKSMLYLHSVSIFSCLSIRVADKDRYQIINSVLEKIYLKREKKNDDKKSCVFILKITIFSEKVPQNPPFDFSDTLTLMLEFIDTEDIAQTTSALHIIQILLKKIFSQPEYILISIFEISKSLLVFDPNYAPILDDSTTEDIFSFSSSFYYNNSSQDFDDDKYLFEEAFSDEDQSDDSWKVRSFAASLLESFIYNLAASIDSNSQNKTIIYEAIELLISRFKERDENVRSVIISELSEAMKNLSVNNKILLSEDFQRISLICLESLATPCSNSRVARSKDMIKNEFKLTQQLVSYLIKLTPEALNSFIFEVLAVFYPKNLRKEMVLFKSISLKREISEEYVVEALLVLDELLKNEDRFLDYLNEFIPRTRDKKFTDAPEPAVITFKQSELILISLLETVCVCLESKNTNSLLLSLRVCLKLLKVFSKSSFLAQNEELNFRIQNILNRVRLSVLEVVKIESDHDTCKLLVEVYEKILTMNLYKGHVNPTAFNEFFKLVFSKITTIKSLQAFGLSSIDNVLLYHQDLIPTIDFRNKNSPVKGCLKLLAISDYSLATNILDILAVILDYTTNNSVSVFEDEAEFNNFLNTFSELYKNTKLDLILGRILKIYQIILPLLKTKDIFKILSEIVNRLYSEPYTDTKVTNARTNIEDSYETNSLELSKDSQNSEASFLSPSSTLIFDCFELHSSYLKFFISVADKCDKVVLLYAFETLLNPTSINQESRVYILLSECISVLCLKSEELCKAAFCKLKEKMQHSINENSDFIWYLYIAAALCFKVEASEFFSEIFSFFNQNDYPSPFDVINSSDNPRLKSPKVREAYNYFLGVSILFDTRALSNLLQYEQPENIYERRAKEQFLFDTIYSATNNLLSWEISPISLVDKKISVEIKSRFPISSIIDLILNLISQKALSIDLDRDSCEQGAKVVSNILLLSPQIACEGIIKWFSSNPDNIPLSFCLIRCMRLSLSQLILNGYIEIPKVFYQFKLSSNQHVIYSVFELCLYVSPEKNPILNNESQYLILDCLKIVNSPANISKRTDNKLGFDLSRFNKKYGKLVIYEFECSRFRDSFVKIEKIGPFKNMVDEGLDSRKLAFQSLNILSSLFPLELVMLGLSSSQTSPDIYVTQTFINALLGGLDDNDFSINLSAINILSDLIVSLEPLPRNGSVVRRIDKIYKTRDQPFEIQRDGTNPMQVAITEVYTNIIQNMLQLLNGIIRLFGKVTKTSDSRQAGALCEQIKYSLPSLAGVLNRFLTNCLRLCDIEIEINADPTISQLVTLFASTYDPVVTDCYDRQLQ